MKKQLFLFVSIFLFSFLIVPAQTAPTGVKQISAGVLNGKAVTLAKPAYPAAARAVGAQGSVNVKVMIDEEGNVISAEAVSGHPLLQQAAVQAAQQSKFQPTTLSGQTVKVTGVVVYNFIAPDRAMNWFKVGYDLANAQNSSTLMFLNTNAIAKNFKTDWTVENEQLQKLSEMKQAAVSTVSQPEVSSQRKISENTERRDDGTTVKRVVAQRVVNLGDPITDEQLAIVQSLTASLQGRLAGNEVYLWQFNLGSSVSEAWAKVGIPSERQRVLDSLSRNLQSAPAAVSADYLAAAQQITTILEKPNLTMEDRQQVLQIIPKLSGNQ